ncbi:MAG: N-acetylmuramoyl-L-alanine amidase [Xanthomonadales bacterium]|nr:N-acetylmuramoyl-L-alanine amidase [Xanthomonadales bacterium]
MNLRTSTLSWVIAPFAVCALLMRPSALDARELQTVRVATEQGVTRVFLDLSEAAPHRFFTLESPRRAVLDLERVTGVTAAMPAAQGSVVGVRTGTQPDSVLRVVVELQPGSRATLQPSLTRDPRGQRLVLEVISGEDPAPVAEVSAPKPVPLKPVRAAHAPPSTRIDREPGMRAVLTRDGDFFLPLRERMRRARAAGAQLFVSVHADAVPNREVTGSSVYVLSDKGATDEQARWLADRENAADLAGGISLDDKDPALASVLVDLTQGAQIWQSMTAAERVLRSLGQVNTVRKPQVQQAGFVVLKSPDIPSMLVETAFISSPVDERLLGIPERRTALAEAIFDGVRQYFVDHPPDGSRFALEREAGRTVLANGGDGSADPGGKPAAAPSPAAGRL